MWECNGVVCISKGVQDAWAICCCVVLIDTLSHYRYPGFGDILRILFYNTMPEYLIRHGFMALFSENYIYLLDITFNYRCYLIMCVRIPIRDKQCDIDVPNGISHLRELYLAESIFKIAPAPRIQDTDRQE